MTVVFLHGLGQTPENWQPVLSQLPPEEDYRCPSLAELLEGKPVCYQNLYAALEAYCSGIPGEFCLCGLSLGAVLALDYSIHHGERLHSVVLIAVQYKMPKALLAVQNWMFHLLPEKNFQGLGFGKKEFTRLCITTGQQNFTKELAEIRCPALILCGQQDKANKKAALGLSRRIPGSRLMLLSKAGHEVNQDNPDALAQALLDFWKTESSRTIGKRL